MDRLGKKLDCPGLHSLHCGGNVTAPTYKDNRRAQIPNESFLQIQAADARQLKIQYEAGCRVISPIFKIVVGGVECNDGHPMGAKQTLQGFPDTCLVIN